MASAMEYIDRLSIYKSIEKKFDEIFEFLKTNYQKVEEYIFIRSERSENKNDIQYLIEVINSKKINDDDYGVVGCVSIGHHTHEVIITIDIIESNGRIISINEYKLLLVNEDIYEAVELNKALVYMHELPDILYLTFLSVQQPFL